MSKYRPGDAVQIVTNLWEARKRGQIYFPPTIMPLLGKHVMIAEVVDGMENDLYFIFEDGQRFMYPVRVFMEDAEPLPSERADSVRHWSDEEIARAQSLICELLALPESGENAGAAYRFIDLVSQDQTRNPNVRPCVLLLQSSLSAQDIKVYAGTADEHDEPNVYIGMAVCLCKAKHRPIPKWIMRPSKKKGEKR